MSEKNRENKSEIKMLSPLKEMLLEANNELDFSYAKVEENENSSFLDGEIFSEEERSGINIFRPTRLDDFIGQDKLIGNLKVMIESSRIRDSHLDHLLLYGPPGLGKTSLAMLMAKEMNSQLHFVSAPSLNKKADLVAILTQVQERDILFIDEIHRMGMALEEVLYSAMEDFKLDIIVGQGPGARSIQIDLCPFTLIAATTRPGALTAPLRDRFQVHFPFDYYQVTDLKLILEKNLKKINLQATDDALTCLAQCSRGTPRIANRFINRIRDLALIHQVTTCNMSLVKEVLKLMDIEEYGLDRIDRLIITTIQQVFNGGPVGIEALASTLHIDKKTIEDVHEPFLLQQGIIARAPRGRYLTDYGKTLQATALAGEVEKRGKVF